MVSEIVCEVLGLGVCVDVLAGVLFDGVSQLAERRVLEALERDGEMRFCADVTVAEESGLVERRVVEAIGLKDEMRVALVATLAAELGVVGNLVLMAKLDRETDSVAEARLGVEAVTTSV